MDLNLSYSSDLIFKALTVETFEEGNIIQGSGEAEAKTTDGLEIFADEFQYNKNKGLLIASGKVSVLDKKNQIILKSETIHYTEIDSKITSYDETDINIENKYFIKTKDLNYKYLIKELFSKSPTFISDNFNNKLELQEFKYFFKEEIVRGKKIYLFDNEDNKYFLEDGIIKLKENLLLGKDITVYFSAKGYEVPDGEPRLKGNSVVYGDNKTIVKKGIFTSCKKTDTCPPWLITSKVVTHDKQKKQIQYKNAWLKIYDRPVMYFPKFFHPDPSVKRQSGFLKPSFGNSRLLGASVNVPYFYVISGSADLTFKPRIFSPTRYLLQSEYRKVTKNSSNIIDFSVNNDDLKSQNGTKTHFFLNSLTNLNLSNFDNSKLDIKLERTSNDGYLKLYSMENENSIVQKTSTLESIIEISGDKNNFEFNTSFEAYETLGQLNSNKYEFIYPNYSIQKTSVLNNKIFKNMDFISYGNQRTHTTNIKEVVQINDLTLSSSTGTFNNGIETSFKTLIKNVNSKGTNSAKFKKRGQLEILSILAYDLSWPLKKNEEKFYKYLTPKILVKHSPNETKNIKDNKHLLNFDNIFDLNRIGNNESIEGGSSITLGLEYEKQDLQFNKFFLLNIANVISNKRNDNLPLTSTLGKKQSDFVGNIYYSPTSNLNFDYKYSVDSALKDANFHLLTTELKINNFITSFDFYEENGLIGDISYFSNNFQYLIDEENSLSFITRRNKKNDLTEFYKLLYEYKNDCLTASMHYNKEYYQGNNVKPFEQLFFNITLIPLGGTQTNNLIPQFEKIETYKNQLDK
jgi:LPS-assembly protein